jgi:hypothetical protein
MQIQSRVFCAVPPLLLGAFVVLGSAPARALSWNVSATFTGSFSGTATGTAVTDGTEAVIGQTYTISSITGVLNALGQSLPISGPTTYQSASNTFVYNGPGTPIFAAGATGISWSFLFSSINVNTNLYNPAGPGIVTAWRTSFSQSGTVTSSSITPVPTPTPGPLPLLGAAAAFRWSRRLRRRQRSLHTPAKLPLPGQPLT